MSDKKAFTVKRCGDGVSLKITVGNMKIDDLERFNTFVSIFSENESIFTFVNNYNMYVTPHSIYNNERFFEYFNALSTSVNVLNTVLNSKDALMKIK